MLKLTGAIAVVLALDFVVAVWAMTGKPGQPSLNTASPAAPGAQTGSIAATAGAGMRGTLTVE